MPASKRTPTTAEQFLNMFKAFGQPSGSKAAVLLLECPDDELGSLLVALYKSGVPIPCIKRGEHVRPV